jgi:DNA polymerase III delta subunit
MLHVFFGTNTETVRQAAYAQLATLKETLPGLEVSRIEPGAYEAGQLASLANTVSLFSGATAYLLDMPSQQSEFMEDVLADAPLLATSEHHFIVIEGALLAADKKILEKQAVTLEESKAGAATRVDVFKLCDALVRKDKRLLWMYLQEVWAEGISTEEIVGVLWWQFKTLRLAAVTKTAAAAGMKDFPYNKAKRALANFKPGEIETLSRSLLTLYHDGHAGKCDLDLALEEWVLRL